MDLITDLPPTRNGYDAIVTFVDQLSKEVHFAPTTKKVDAVGPGPPALHGLASTHLSPYGFSLDVMPSLSPHRLSLEPAQTLTGLAYNLPKPSQA